jgi:GNAT superfamily N-acetyltransferase
VDAAGFGAQASPATREGSAVALVVRQARVSDRPAIADFLVEAYGAKAPYKGERRWTWQFSANPFSNASDGLATVWIALDGGRVVGQIGVQAGALQVEDRSEDAGWIVDVMILAGYRGRGLGHRLHEGAAQAVDALVTLTMAPATRRIAERADCITLGRVRQLSRWVRLDHDTVRRYLLLRTTNHPRFHALARFACGALLLHRVLPAIVNPLLRLRDSVTRSHSRPGPTQVREVDAFGEDFDRLWERTRRDFPVIFSRDSRFLNWRFVDCPGLTYRRFTAHRGGDTVGYVVLRSAEPVELRQGMIVDLYAARHDAATIEDLVRHSVSFFGRDVATIECATSIPEFEAVFRRHGFFPTRTERPTCVCRDPALRSRLEQLKDSWFFSKGDHDWDQIHLA